MSRGPGRIQRGILDTLRDHGTGVVVWQLALHLEAADNAVRRAVYALERVGLVKTTRGHVGYSQEGDRPVYGLRVWLPEQYDEAVEFASERCYRFKYHRRVRDESMIPRLIHTHDWRNLNEDDETPED